MKRNGRAWFVLFGALTAACTQSTEERSQNTDAGTSALYAMMVQVYSPTDRTVYVSLSNTLDIDSTHLETSREFPGVANFAAIDGKLLVSSGSEPLISEFEINDKLEWLERRQVSFAGYPLTDNANFYYQFIVDPNNALLPYDQTKRIHWNPREMTITGKLEDTTLAADDHGRRWRPAATATASSTTAR